MTDTKNTVSDVDWLDEAARYFENRDTGGEDMAFWANVSNAERCRSIAQSLRASIPGGVGVLSVADAITQLSAAIEAEKRRNAARDQMLATVIVNLEKSEMTAEFAVLLRDYVRAERSKLSALDLLPAEEEIGR